MAVQSAAIRTAINGIDGLNAPNPDVLCGPSNSTYLFVNSITAGAASNGITTGASLSGGGVPGWTSEHLNYGADYDYGDGILKIKDLPTTDPAEDGRTWLCDAAGLAAALEAGAQYVLMSQGSDQSLMERRALAPVEPERLSPGRARRAVRLAALQVPQ